MIGNMVNNLFILNKTDLFKLWLSGRDAFSSDFVETSFHLFVHLVGGYSFCGFKAYETSGVASDSITRF